MILSVSHYLNGASGGTVTLRIIPKPQIVRIIVVQQNLRHYNNLWSIWQSCTEIIIATIACVAPLADDDMDADGNYNNRRSNSNDDDEGCMEVTVQHSFFRRLSIDALEYIFNTRYRKHILFRYRDYSESDPPINVEIVVVPTIRSIDLLYMYLC
jgi:hypothetical protein